jgi:hypothetical protein
MRHRRWEAIDVGRGDLQCTSRPHDVAHPGNSLAPEGGVGGLADGWSHLGAHARGEHLQHRSLGLNSGQPPAPWSLGYPVCHFFVVVFLFWTQVRHMAPPWWGGAQRSPS